MVVGLAAVVTGCAGSEAGESRPETVASRGAEVMPFDLESTTHTFTKTSSGGLQTVTADDPDDSVQIALIRQHLAEEQENFARGDFSDPARIHGMDMPGVEELSTGYDRITVTYAELPAGASLDYTTDDGLLVDAIHSWFDRQEMDHGSGGAAG